MKGALPNVWTAVAPFEGLKQDGSKDPNTQPNVWTAVAPFEGLKPALLPPQFLQQQAGLDGRCSL